MTFNLWANMIKYDSQSEKLWLKPFTKGLREREGRALTSRHKAGINS